MMLRPRLARASPDDFANDIAATEAQARRDRCLALGEIPALQELSGCDRVAALGRWELNCARSPARSHQRCPALVAFDLVDQLHRSTCRARQANLFFPSTSTAGYGCGYRRHQVLPCPYGMSFAC